MDEGTEGKAAVSDATESSDRRRLSAAEQDIAVMQSNARTSAGLLEAISRNQTEALKSLEAVKAAQYPPFYLVLQMLTLGAALMGSTLAAYFFLTDGRIREATRLLEYRMGRIEQSVVLTPTFTPAPATVPEQPQR